MITVIMNIVIKVTASLAQQGVNGSVVPLLLREHGAAKVLDRVGSQETLYYSIG